MSTVAQVVPDLATFSVDDGFAYRVPEGMDVAIGSIVRVPLGGRRIRGWVTSLREGPGAELKSVIGVSGAHAIYTAELLQSLRWAAVHYVAPLAALLPRSGPPNLPTPGRASLREIMEVAPPPDALMPLTERLGEGIPAGTVFVPAPSDPSAGVAALCGAAAIAERSSWVVAPTAREAVALAEQLRARYGNRVVISTSSRAAAERTKAWSQARRSAGTIVVGTPEVALWPVARPALAIVLEEGRRAMKARQTPTLHVRDVLRRRGATERFGLVFVGQVPSLAIASLEPEVIATPGRSWPLVEVADRTEEPPTSSPLGDATRAAIGGAVKRDQRVFVFVSRRGYAPAVRCTRCGELRRCVGCGSSPGREATCVRCGTVNGPCQFCGSSAFSPVGAALGRVLDDLKRSLGELVTAVGQGGLVQVGTEADLPGPGTVDLAVVVDADSMLLRPHYRAEEEALRVLARVAATVRRGRGRRCLIQTRLSAHRVIAAASRGRWEEVTAALLAEREDTQLPPYGELLALELAGDLTGVDDEVRQAAGQGVAVFGPGVAGGTSRWLIQAPQLRPSKIRLRPAVQRWRDRNIKVRVDADPIDV